MKFTLKTDGDYCTGSIMELNISETLVVNSALRRMSEDEDVPISDRCVALKMGKLICEQANNSDH